MASFIASSARFVRPLVLASVFAVLAACGSDSSGPANDADVSGQYSLVTVDGHALPDTIPNAEHVLVIAAANVLFSDNGSYESSVTGTDDDSEEQEIAADNGTFTICRQHGHPSQRRVLRDVSGGRRLEWRGHRNGARGVRQLEQRDDRAEVREGGLATASASGGRR